MSMRLLSGGRGSVRDVDRVCDGAIVSRRPRPLCIAEPNVESKTCPVCIHDREAAQRNAPPCR